MRNAMNLRDQIAAARALADAATEDFEWTNGHYQGSYLGQTLIVFGDTYEDGEADAAFIAASRTLVPHLAGLLERACELLIEVNFCWACADGEVCEVCSQIELSGEISAFLAGEVKRG